MNEYNLTLQNAVNLGTPIFNNLSSLLVYSNCTKQAIKDSNFDIMLSCTDFIRSDKPKYNSFYSIQLGLFTASVTAIKVSSKSKRVTVLRVRMEDIMDSEHNTTVLIDIPDTALVDKQYLDQGLLSLLLKYTKRKGYKWWDFLRLSEGSVATLKYNNRSVGYRFEMTHKMLAPLYGEFNLDMDLDTARKIGYKPKGARIEPVNLVGDSLMSEAEVQGQRVFDISNFKEMCKDLAGFMYY